MMVRQVVLRFKTDTVADRQILPSFPVVLSINPEVIHSRTDRVKDLVILN